MTSKYCMLCPIERINFHSYGKPIEKPVWSAAVYLLHSIYFITLYDNHQGHASRSAFSTTNSLWSILFFLIFRTFEAVFLLSLIDASSEAE